MKETKESDHATPSHEPRTRIGCIVAVSASGGGEPERRPQIEKLLDSEIYRVKGLDQG